jgi:hypothetical protein
MMKKIGFLFMATLALGSFSGCKKKGGDAMAKMGEFKDHMCACKDGDKDCAMKVQKEMADYAEANKDMKDQKMSDEDMKKATDIGMEMAKCSAKAMGAGAMGAPPAAPPAPPAGDKPAEGAPPAGDKPAGDKPAEAPPADKK